MRFALRNWFGIKFFINLWKIYKNCIIILKVIDKIKSNIYVLLNWFCFVDNYFVFKWIFISKTAFDREFNADSFYVIIIVIVNKMLIIIKIFSKKSSFYVFRPVNCTYYYILINNFPFSSQK